MDSTKKNKNNNILPITIEILPLDCLHVIIRYIKNVKTLFNILLTNKYMYKNITFKPQFFNHIKFTYRRKPKRKISYVRYLYIPKKILYKLTKNDLVESFQEIDKLYFCEEYDEKVIKIFENRDGGVNFNHRKMSFVKVIDKSIRKWKDTLKELVLPISSKRITLCKNLEKLTCCTCCYEHLKYFKTLKKLKYLRIGSFLFKYYAPDDSGASSRFSSKNVLNFQYLLSLKKFVLGDIDSKYFELSFFETLANFPNEKLEEIKACGICMRKFVSSFISRSSGFNTFNNGTYINVKYMDCENVTNEVLKECKSLEKLVIRNITCINKDFIVPKLKLLRNVKYIMILSSRYNFQEIDIVNECLDEGFKYIVNCEDFTIDGHRNISDRGLENIYTFTKIVKLQIKSNFITSQGIRKFLVNIKVLDLSSKSIDSSSIEGLKKLRILRIDRFERVDQLDFSFSFKKMKDLLVLSILDGIKVTDELFKSITTVKSLEILLVDEKITEKGLILLTDLSELYLEGSISHINFDEIFKSIKTLINVDLNNSEEDISFINKISELKQLYPEKSIQLNGGDTEEKEVRISEINDGINDDSKEGWYECWYGKKEDDDGFCESDSSMDENWLS